MARYRRKPGRIDAVQWQDDGRFNETPDWLLVAMNLPTAALGRVFVDEADAMVRTPDGWRRCKPGDYVVRRGNGELFPLSGEVFQQCYERDETPAMR